MIINVIKWKGYINYMKKNKKIDKYAKRRIGLVVIVITLIISIFFIFNGKNHKENDKVRLLIGGNYVELKDEIYIDSFDNIYLSKEDILKLYDPNIYYEQIENTLITAHNKHIAILKLDENKININGSNIETQASLIKLNDKIYLPFSEMEIIYDFEYDYCKETNTIIVNSISEEKKQAKVVKKSVKLKKESKLFSSNIEKIKKDGIVTIIGENEKYYKVITQKGNIGYIRKKQLSEVEKVRDSMENSKMKEVNFLEYNDISKDYSDIKIDKKKNNIVIINAFNIKNFIIENKIDFSSKNYTNYIEWTKENEIITIATITCDDEVVNDFLSYEKRNNIIKELYKKIINNKINGVNINFQNINDVNSFYRFIIELAPMFREAGIKTMVTYNTVLKEDKLDSIVDYVIK